VACAGKIVSLSIGLLAFSLLAVFGFAIWVFIPLLPAVAVFAIAVAAGKRRAAKQQVTAEAALAADLRDEAA
jgi:hypothetical protein